MSRVRDLPGLPVRLYGDPVTAAPGVPISTSLPDGVVLRYEVGGWRKALVVDDWGRPSIYNDAGLGWYIQHSLNPEAQVILTLVRLATSAQPEDTTQRIDRGEVLLMIGDRP